MENLEVAIENDELVEVERQIAALRAELGLQKKAAFDGYREV
jgi:hypothetical protein